mgnify:CR=1 FL=1
MNDLLQKEYEEFIKRECLIKDGVVTVGLGNLQDWLSAHDKRVLEGVGEIIDKMPPVTRRDVESGENIICADDLKANLLQAGE